MRHLSGMVFHRHIIRPLPGIALCVAITAAAFLGERIERATFGRAWIEALVLAILFGVGAAHAMDARRALAARRRNQREAAAGDRGRPARRLGQRRDRPCRGAGAAVRHCRIVVVAIAASFAIGRVLGLPYRMALLVACGNSICGNSAIAAVAPVIDADGDDVAAAIAFTAVLGVIVVLGLPLLGVALGMSGLGYGALAGLTVYAVPQVIAAAAPLGLRAVQIGTLVKLVRVLMLGPVCCRPVAGERPSAARGATPPLHKLVPWFIIGFLALVAARSADLIPHAALAPIAGAATLLTVISMAALGLSTDLRTVARAGGRVTAAVCLSLVVLIALSLAFLHMIGLH